MATVKPFRGLLYRQDLRDAQVMAPPYDVISPKQREMLKNQSPYNIVNLTLPDTYELAKITLNEWLSKGILMLDDTCSIYGYKAHYKFNGQEKSLNGIVAALKLEPLGGHIKPHEKTLKGPKIDRFNLITATNAMFCPIMGLYEENETIKGILEEPREPIFKARFEQIDHELFRIAQKREIEEIQSALEEKDTIIADGHHRYETALMIKDYYNKQGLKSGWFDYIMMLLVDAKSGGLTLGAIHRLIKKLDDMQSFKDKLKKYFVVSETRLDNADFVMYHNHSYSWLKFKGKRNGVVERLNTSIFEDYIYKKILNLSDDDIKNQRIAGYAHSIDELKELVDSRKAEVGFILKPMSFEDLVEVTKHGLTVPQKSTYFYPKIPSGLVGYYKNSMKGC